MPWQRATRARVRLLHHRLTMARQAIGVLQYLSRLRGRSLLLYLLGVLPLQLGNRRLRHGGLLLSLALENGGMLRLLRVDGLGWQFGMDGLLSGRRALKMRRLLALHDVRGKLAWHSWKLRLTVWHVLRVG